MIRMAVQKQRLWASGGELGTKYRVIRVTADTSQDGVKNKVERRDSLGAAMFHEDRRVGVTVDDRGKRKKEDHEVQRLSPWWASQRGCEFEDRRGNGVEGTRR